MARVCRKPGVRTLLVAATAVLFAAGLAGCYESNDITLADPGHYKGQSDPLMQKLQPGSKLNKQLDARFKLVQAAE